MCNKSSSRRKFSEFLTYHILCYYKFFISFSIVYLEMISYTIFLNYVDCLDQSDMIIWVCDNPRFHKYVVPCQFSFVCMDQKTFLHLSSSILSLVI